jgi:hypothetical protein
VAKNVHAEADVERSPGRPRGHPGSSRGRRCLHAAGRSPRQRLVARLRPRYGGHRDHSGWLKDFAVEKFGSNDKPILLASVFVVMALASAVVGVIASRRLRLGLVLAAALNLVALGGAVKTLNGLDLSAGTILPGCSRWS